MTVGSRGMFLGELAMFERRSCVLFRLFVLAEIVKMGRLQVMVRGGVVVSCRLKVMLTRRMLRCLCHFRYPSLRVNICKRLGYFPHMTGDGRLNPNHCVNAQFLPEFPATQTSIVSCRPCNRSRLSLNEKSRLEFGSGANSGSGAYLPANALSSGPVSIC
jgi:hypothetical protein